MKNSILYIILLLFFACNNKKEKTLNLNLPEIVFTKDTFDFNTIRKNDSVKATFVFKNTGKSDLIIKNMSVGCGCTKIASYKDTIVPDESGNIDIVYHSSNDTSLVLKTIIVETNCKPKLHVLYIKGIVQ